MPPTSTRPHHQGAVGRAETRPRWVRALAIFMNLRPLGRDPVVVAGQPLSYSDKVKVHLYPLVLGG